MIYAQTDSQGFYVGLVAFENTEDQPSGAIDAPEPIFDPATEKAKWDGCKWVIDTIENWSKSEPPTQDRLNAQRASEIISELARLDREAIRPLRAKAAGNNTAEDQAKIDDLDAKSQDLRDELKTLQVV